MNLSNTLLRLYPREWRARYEEEFTVLIEQKPLSLIDIADIALGALDAHLRPQVAAEQVKSERRLFVNRASFIKWSGLAGMVGSMLVLLGLVGIQVFADSEYPYTYDGLDIGASLFFLAGAALTLVFVVGFALAYGRKIGGLGQAGLLVALMGLLSLGSGGIGQLSDAIRGSETGWWWNFLILGLMGTLIGVGLSCLAGSTRKVLPPVGSKLSAIGGLGGLTVLLVSTGLISGADSETMKVALIAAFTACLVVFNVGLFLLGYALWSAPGVAGRQLEPAPLA